jgi:hypothetical protein
MLPFPKRKAKDIEGISNSCWNPCGKKSKRFENIGSFCIVI